MKDVCGGNELELNVTPRFREAEEGGGCCSGPEEETSSLGIFNHLSKNAINDARAPIVAPLACGELGNVK